MLEAYIQLADCCRDQSTGRIHYLQKAGLLLIRIKALYAHNVPRNYLYGSILHPRPFVNCQRIERVFHMQIRAMRASGTMPTVATFTCIVSALARTGQMTKVNGQPSPFRTYT
jgi:hypothetical protein